MGEIFQLGLLTNGVYFPKMLKEGDEIQFLDFKKKKGGKWQAKMIISKKHLQENAND